MALNTAEVLIGANGNIYAAPVGTTAPADFSIAYSASWLELGYADEDGLNFSQGRDFEDINAWQEFDPVRMIVTGRNVSMSFNLLQWNKNTLPLAMGGGTIVTSGTGGTLKYQFTPAAAGTIDERAFSVSWVDGTRNFRLFIPRGIVTDEVSFALNKASAAALTLSVRALGVSGSSGYYLYSSDTGAFA